MNLNCDIYFFGELGKGYTQFPNDSKHFFSTIYGKWQKETRLTYVHDGKLSYYGYTRPLYGGEKYIGVGCVFNDVLCTDFVNLFGIFEDVVRDLARQGLPLEDDAAISKTFPIGDNLNQDTIESIANTIRDRLSSHTVSFIKLPPVKYSIDSSETKSFGFYEDANAIAKAMREYPRVCISKEVVETETSHSRQNESKAIDTSFNIPEAIESVLGSISSILFWGLIGLNLWHVKTKIVDYVNEDLLNRNPKKKVVYLEGFWGIDFNMRLVEGGTFTMGASEEDMEAKFWEKPAHNVTLDSYYIAQTEVSQKLWEAVMGNNPSRHVGKNLPVDCVSWEDCVEFCNRLSQKTGRHFRLPTEAEWEYAARGGNKSCNYKFSGGNVLDKVAWSLDNSDSTAHRIMKKRSNELGLYDMTGNAWEICNDWYASYTDVDVVNPQGPDSSEKGRVRRGGGWLNNAKYCRVSYRYYTPDGQRNDFLSFRLVMDLPVKEKDK